MFSSLSKTLFIKFSNIIDYRQAVLVCVIIHFFSNNGSKLINTNDMFASKQGLILGSKFK